MADVVANGSDLVDFFSVYAPGRFKKPSGEPMGRRSLQKKIKKFDLPVIQIGWTSLIDPVAGDNQLRRFARRPPDREARGRGRAKRK